MPRSARDKRLRLDPQSQTPQESSMAKSAKTPAKKAFAPRLPDSLSARRKGDIAILRLSRPHTPNARNDGTILGIGA
jgi:hypothetical protein